MINTSDIIGQTLYAITVNVTGHIFLTMLFVVILLIAVTYAFGGDLLLSSVLLIPFLIVCFIYVSDIYSVIGIITLVLVAYLARILFR